MFKFVHAWQPGDSWEPLAANGFIGIECPAMAPAANLPTGVRVVGLDSVTLIDSAEGVAMVADAPDVAPAYSIDFYTDSSAASEMGEMLRETVADYPPGCLVLASNAVRRTPAARVLWDILEAARHPQVKAALDIDAAQAVGERAAVLVPTLNLRIGVVRAGHIEAELADYARRLAGIGFDGYIVTDPPAGPDRAAASLAIAAAFRAVLPPVKPVKKTPAKVVK